MSLSIHDVAGPGTQNWLDLAPHLGALPLPSDPALHWNRPEQLAPVGCWLLVRMPGGHLAHARRTSYIEKKNRDQEYEFRNGMKYIGKLEWTPA